MWRRPWYYGYRLHPKDCKLQSLRIRWELLRSSVFLKLFDRVRDDAGHDSGTGTREAAALMVMEKEVKASRGGKEAVQWRTVGSLYVVISCALGNDGTAHVVTKPVSQS